MRVVHYAKLDGRLHAEPLCGVWGSMDTDWTNDSGGVTCEPCRAALPAPPDPFRRPGRAAANQRLEPTVKTDMRSENATREAILELLSDEEIARVSTAEGAARLLDGEEYVDLEHPGHGVRRAAGTFPPMGNVLPRRAVHEATWSKILARLEPPRSPATRQDA